MLMPTPTPALRNAMSIDVEDYFQVSAFAPYIRREDWNGLECRVERNILHAGLDRRTLPAGRQGHRGRRA
jgi:hypothetical protein